MGAKSAMAIIASPRHYSPGPEGILLGKVSIDRPLGIGKTMRVKLTVNLPSSMPAGKYNLFAEVINRAEAENKSRFVNFGFLQEAQLRFPTILRVLNDPTLFEKVAELQGFEPINIRYVYRYKPGSAKGRNLLNEFEQLQDAEAAGTPDEGN